MEQLDLLGESTIHKDSIQRSEAAARSSRCRQLRINWVLPRSNPGGGIKSNKLIAEAMLRRGHDVRLA
jgi:hypothetical protein